MRFDGKTTPRKLSLKRVRRIDLVPSGANQLSHVTLAKSAGAPPTRPVRKEDAPMPTLAEQIAELSEEDQEAIVQYVDDLNTALSAERTKSEEALTALSKAEADLAAAKADDGDSDSEAELLKGMDPAVAALVTKARTEAAEAREQAAAVVKAERTRTFKATAGALVNLSGGPDTDGATRLGAILDAAEKALSAEHYAELERTLVAADAQVTKAEDVLTKAVGHGSDGPDGGDAREVVQKRAKELEAEGLSPLDAIRKARAENAEAVAEAQAAATEGRRA